MKTLMCIETSKPVIGLPPSLAGTVQVSVACPSPGAASKFSGASGTVRAADGVAVADA